MADKEKLNYVAYKIIEIFEATYPRDQFYIDEKIERLAEFSENKAETLHWAMSQLDDRNFKLLCEKLDLAHLDQGHFNVFEHIMQKL